MNEKSKAGLKAMPHACRGLSEQPSLCTALWRPQCHPAHLVLMSEYLGEEAVRAHEAKIEGIRARAQMMIDAIKEQESKEISAAMQELDSQIFTHRFYHEAPDDVFETFVKKLSDVREGGWGNGGFNKLRLVSKRCLQVVESVATWLTGKKGFRPASFPKALTRCGRMKYICCDSLGNLEGCPDGLEGLYIITCVRFPHFETTPVDLQVSIRMHQTGGFEDF